ncbi:hypothetical protein [Oceanobacter sp. 4_MG-2023]|uniref:hypothetical protein n=1 Tax=Oceanobacter sp. 4_MG-2023 TaxID=3062623 RepID=UPI00273663A9|nr:hypothetical protein [Oceanobacter sp. 4_MG-2023]MDP2548906.1 hypothetical protein [Oceanobacter sp. 4_MG-2023]
MAKDLNTDQVPVVEHESGGHVPFISPTGELKKISLDKLYETNLSENVSDEAGTNVQDALYTVNQRSIAPLLTQQCLSRVVRILFTGTSIEASSASGYRMWFESLKAAYGDSGNLTEILAALGGSYEDIYDGWYKQPFSGLRLHRLRGDSDSDSITLRRGFSRRILIRYSTETDGGSCDVDVNGVYYATIDCSGAQSMANELNIDFDDIGYHTITFHPPTTGYVYLESIDWCLDNPGIHVMDGTYGGSTIQNYIIDRPTVGTQVDPVPVVGDTGLEALFNNQSEYSKPDLVILPYTVNDAGTGVSNVENYAIPTMNKVIEYTRESGAHCITMCEMGGHYSMPASSRHTSFKLMRNAILSTKLEPHVTMIDWHWLSGLDTDDEEQLAVLAARYYNATNVDISAGTFDGDFIHPNYVGQSVISDALHALSGTPHIVDTNTALGADPQIFSTSSTIPRDAPMYSDELVNNFGFSKEALNQLGTINRYTIIGNAINPVSHMQEPLWACPEELGFTAQYATDIEESTTEDQYGKYVDYSSESMYMKNPLGFADSSKKMTVTMLVGEGDVNMRVNNYSNTERLPMSLRGIDNPDIGGSITAGYVFKNREKKPKIFSMTFLIDDSTTYFVTTGRLYGFWITATDFACIPGTTSTNAHYLSSPQTATAELALSNVIEGQEYIDNGISKIALRRPCVNAITGGTESLYRCADISDREFMTLEGTLTEGEYNDRLGGPEYSTSSGTVYWSGASTFGESDGGTDMGIVLPGMYDYGPWKLTLYSSSSGRTLYMDDTGVWHDSNQAIYVDCYRGMPMFIPFTLPTDTALWDGYSNYKLRVQQLGGTPPKTKYLSLCPGVLATV